MTNEEGLQRPYFVALWKPQLWSPKERPIKPGGGGVRKTLQELPEALQVLP